MWFNNTFNLNDISLFQNLKNNLKERIIFPSSITKPDLIFYGNNNNNENILCTLQCKNEMKKMTISLFKIAIDSLNPWHFFDGASNLKSKFLDWWSKNANIFDKYIRVLLFLFKNRLLLDFLVLVKKF